MNLATLSRIALVTPAAVLLFAGAASACPPEVETEGRLLRTNELGLADQFFRIEPSMAVFSDGQSVKGVYYGQDETQQRYRVVQPGTKAEAQALTATRGNAQASARARALLELDRAVARRAQVEDEMQAKQEAPKQKLRTRQPARAMAPQAPLPPMPPAPPGEEPGVFVEGHAIIVGPDGTITEQTLGGTQRRTQPQLRMGQKLQAANAQHDATLQEHIALEHAAAAAMPRVWVGVELAEPDAAIVRYFDLQPGQTTEIVKVYDESPAQKAGLQDRDIVVKLNGAEMAGPDVLREVVGGSHPGDKVRVTVLRKGRTHEVDLRPALREQPAAAGRMAGESDQEAPRQAAPSRNAGREDLERRLDRLERLLEKLLERQSQD